MRILLQQLLSSNHSWAICGQNIARSLINKQHQVDLYSTNGIKFFPDDLIPNLIGHYDPTTHQSVGQISYNDYDCQISYTAPKNFPLYLSHGSKNRFGIWTFEYQGLKNSNALPEGFAKHYRDCDLILAPSQFSKQIFLDSGVPESHLKVIPHGIDFNQVDTAIPYPLKTRKSTKIAIVIGQVHRRKNLPDMLEMYGRAFTNKDDVCLVIKVQDVPPTQPFELSFQHVFAQFKTKFPRHAEIEIVREFVPNIFSIYKACDIVFYATNCEGFGLISLEAMACGKINVTSRYGGVLDFCNDDNSLLLDGKLFNVPPNYLYWAHKTNTQAFAPNIDDGISKLRYAVTNKEALLQQAQSHVQYFKDHYSWDQVTKQILELTQ